MKSPGMLLLQWPAGSILRSEGIKGHPGVMCSWSATWGVLGWKVRSSLRFALLVSMIYGTYILISSPNQDYNWARVNQDPINAPMQDEWCLERKIKISLYSCPIVNHSGYLFTNHSHASTYLVVIKCLHYCMFIHSHYSLPTHLQYIPTPIGSSSI
jgi:hypothetical protein